MFRKTLAIASFVVIAISLAAAADVPKTSVNLTAAQIVDKNVSARGGLQAWRAVQALEMTGNTITETRLALGGVAHKPWRNTDAEAALRGQAANEPGFARAADTLLRGARGHTHNAFKIELARRAIVRTLTQAARSTPQSQSNKKIA